MYKRQDPNVSQSSPAAVSTNTTTLTPTPTPDLHPPPANPDSSSASSLRLKNVENILLTQGLQYDYLYYIVQRDLSRYHALSEWTKMRVDT